MRPRRPGAGKRRGAGRGDRRQSASARPSVFDASGRGAPSMRRARQAVPAARRRPRAALRASGCRVPAAARRLTSAGSARGYGSQPRTADAATRDSRGRPRARLGARVGRLAAETVAASTVAPQHRRHTSDRIRRAGHWARGRAHGPMRSGGFRRNTGRDHSVGPSVQRPGAGRRRCV